MNWKCWHDQEFPTFSLKHNHFCMMSAFWQLIQKDTSYKTRQTAERRKLDLLSSDSKAQNNLNQSVSNNGSCNSTRSQRSSRCITEDIASFPFCFTLGRSRPSLSLWERGTQVNQIKWDWAYQSSALLQGLHADCPSTRHLSFPPQFTWKINSAAECTAHVSHLHKSNFVWNIQSSPLARDRLQSLCCDWNNGRHWVLSRRDWRELVLCPAALLPLVPCIFELIACFHDRIWGKFLILLTVYTRFPETSTNFHVIF